MKLEQSVADSIIAQPDEIDVIKEEAAKLIKSAGISGVFPTPIDKILETANIEQLYDLEEAHKSFLETAGKETRIFFLSALNKIRGFADLKKRINYIAPEPKIARKNWVKLHELGHQYLYWQKDALAFVEDNRSLSPECEDQFEREANAFAGEVLFQGDVFKEEVSSLRPDFNTIFHFANQFGASRHGAARQLAVESEEPLALVSYYKSNRYISEDGRPVFVLGRAHSASETFLRKYPQLKIPQQLKPGHAWTQAITSSEVASGTQQFDCGDGTTASFMWEAWWNTYNLLVLIRKTPKLKAIGSFLDF